MPEYLAPGLFVEEIDSGSKPIEGVGINTAAFIGYAKSGEFNKPTFVSSWTQFCETFGEDENGITKALCDELKMTVAEVRAAKKASPKRRWSEFAEAAIKKAIADKSNGVKTAVTVASYREFLRKHKLNDSPVPLPYRDDSYLAHAVYGYYLNGGNRAYVVRVAHPEDIKALSYGQKTSVPAAQAKIAAGPLLLTAKEPGSAGNQISVEVEHTDRGFTLKVSQPHSEPETWGTKERPLTVDSAPSAVKSKIIQVEKVATATAERPEAKVFVLAEGADATTSLATGGATTALAASPLSNGLANLVPSDFIGDEAQRTGAMGLGVIDDINMVCVPDLMAGVWKREEFPQLEEAPKDGSKPPVPQEEVNLTDSRRQEILNQQKMVVAYCERAGNRMAILDPLPGLNAQEMKELALNTEWNSQFGQAALYYPWIKVLDPAPERKGATMFVPPCGHIAGVWARVGNERGVHKAPANEFVRGAVALEIAISKNDQEILNPNGVNAIRSFPGRGIKIWGARTLATVGNPSWKYVNVRRLFNYLKDSLDRNLQWVVFEPNDHDLWGRVRRTISAFLWTEWKEGKLFGMVPDEAYYVKCDSETNPQEMIDLGRLYVEIGINPVKPAEFVIIRMGQWSGGGSMSEQ